MKIATFPVTMPPLRATADVRADDVDTMSVTVGVAASATAASDEGTATAMVSDAAERRVKVRRDAKCRCPRWRGVGIVKDMGCAPGGEQNARCVHAPSIGSRGKLA